MIVPFAKVYNASSLWLPSDDTDRDAVVVFESPVNFSHSSRPFSFICAKASTIAFSGW
ncbi:TPA: hypothetical protein ACXNLO_001319 [Enterobacter cloacae]|uniref:Uncharacterized protein n=1 Tax=Enterobacter cloacae TaxID=550 RepID=A0AAW6NTL7_ENTCL|nr:hypothetical protein [Enterobacter cloacae]MCE1358784.1 hypothetical protein [Enterobacter kobei]MDF3569193.1 hypothetical protein [Enterobacter cloacae]MDF3639979.1 hypothetical protein [Enterobacter cloacae]